MRTAKTASLILFFLLCFAVGLSARDSRDYPLRVEILWSHWENYNLAAGSNMPYFMHKVNGRGNVRDGDAVHAFDFEYRGSINIGGQPHTQTYMARWKKPQDQLEILMPDVGHEGRYAPCDMATNVREGVYVESKQGPMEISQASYLARKSAPTTTGAFSAVKASAAVSKLVVSSNPDSADIDIDGAFMGTTPSTLELSLGEHSIALHKSGYAPWQRNMKVVSGDITLNADLEPAKPK